MSSSTDTAPILITGAHRTGTTWVGKVLAEDSQIAYVSEPLHLNHSPGVLSEPVYGWYQYICDENGDRFLDAYGDTIQFRYKIWKAIQHINGIKSAGKVVIDQASFLANRLQKKRILLKDPFAIFSVPWFIDRLNTKTVIMVRHPLSFISSLHRLGWCFDFNDLLNQPLLMQDYLEPFREEMIQANRSKEDIVAQGILLWRIIYSIVGSYIDRKFDVLIVRHEDISMMPEKKFSDIKDYLGIGESEAINKAIRHSTQAGNPAEVSENNEHAVFLDSRANLQNWKKRLTEEDITRIVSDTQDVAGNFYKPEEWSKW
jgi:hypothetical protein